MTKAMQRSLQKLCAVGVVGALIAVVLWSVSGPAFAPSASAGVFDVSGTVARDGHTLEYTVTGVEPDENDEPFNHSGTVTARQVTLSGSASYTIGEGGVTNLFMNASVSVGDQSASDSWPPPDVNGRVGGTTVTFPFNLTVDVPPPPPPSETAPPFAEEEQDDGPEPYATLSFSVSSRNCNDSGVCGGPSAAGSFLVFALPTPSPTVDWTATAGALGAAAAVAAAAGIIGRKNEGEDDEPAERWRYVLQVATDELVVDVDSGASLDAEVWAVNSKGQVMAASTSAVTAVISGPFGASSSSGQGSLHTGVTTAGPPGSTGSALVTAIAGPIQMSTTVALRAEGQYLLECVPVGEPVLRPDPATRRYSSVDVDVVVKTANTPVACTLVGAEALPDGLVTLTQLDTPGSQPGVRLHIELAADPAVLIDPVNQSVELQVWAAPADVPDAETLTAKTTIRLQPPAATVHWMRTGNPETLDTIIELEAEHGAELDLEVWLESTDDTPVPQAEFSHMVNVDLDGTQLAPTKADFSCHPESRPWQVPALDNRAHSRWRVNHELPSAERPDLVPPVDTAIRVRAWPAGAVTRNEEAISATEPRLAQALVPVRLNPVRLVAELVEPTQALPADGTEQPVMIQVLRERDRTAYVGPLLLAVSPAESRAVATLAVQRFELGPDDNGQLQATLTTPELTYRADVDYAETIQISIPAATGAGKVVAEVAVPLAPAISITLSREKKGLVWEEPSTPIERPASDRVSAISGQVRVTAKQSKAPEQETDVVVELATVNAHPGSAATAGGTTNGSASPAAEPLATATTEKMGRFELQLPGLVASPDVAPVDLSFDELPRGVLAPDVCERLDLYERRVLPSVERGRRPLSTLVGAAHADTLGTWRFETLRKLASEADDRYDDVLGAIELAEPVAVYTDAFARTYYDLISRAVDTLGALLGDIMSYSFTKLEVGKYAAGAANYVGKGTIGILDNYVVGPGIALLRSIARRLVGLVDDMLRLIDVPSAKLTETATAIKELWEVISTATDLDKVVEAAVDLLVNAALYLSRAVHTLIVKSIHRLLPLTQTIMDSLAPALGPHLNPGWQKLCEDSIKQMIDELGVMPWAAGGIGDQIKNKLDPFPLFAGRAADSVLRDLDGLRVPSDPEARRDIPKDAFGSISTTAFEHQQLFATADECLAWFNLISTAVQLIMIGVAAAKGVLKGVAAVAGDTLGPYLKWTSNKLDVIDILTTMINGAVHASEMTTSLIMGYAVAEHGTASVKALT